MTDMEYWGEYETEYILPCDVNTLSIDDITIECDFNGIAYLRVFAYWVCLYSEEKLQSMERNLNVETLSSGVKRILHEK